MILLSVAGLLLGAGFGPPLLGKIVGITATRIHAPLERWRSRRFLAALWPWAYAGALASWLFLCPGSLILSRLFPRADLWLVPAVATPSSFGLLILTIVTALAHDAREETAARLPGTAGSRPAVRERRA